MLEVVDDTNYIVVLIDKEFTITSHSSYISIIPTELKEVETEDRDGRIGSADHFNAADQARQKKEGFRFL